MSSPLRRRTLPIVAVGLAAGLAVAPAARAETCPAQQPGWLRGRVVVFEPNLSPAATRGVGEIFVYAYRRGASVAGSRFMAVSDPEGYFCVHDTSPGDWVVTTWEPFSYRPLVRELTCTATACDLGELSLDQGLRISDDYIAYDDDWWGGPLAQSITVPADAVSLAKATFRSGGESTNDVQVFAGASTAAAPLGRSSVGFPGGGGRGTAAFRPGEIALQPGQTATIAVGGGWAPYRQAGDPYPGGAAFQIGGDGALTPVAATDLCLNLDFDGPDGNLTSFLVTATDGNTFGSDVAQAFVARSRSVSHASAFTGGPDGFRRVTMFVTATLDGPPIGPVKETIGLNEQGVAAAWFDGEVVTEPGQTYFLHLGFPEAGHAVYTRRAMADGAPPNPDLVLYADGQPVEGSIWGRVMGPGPEAAGSVDAGPEEVHPDAEPGTPADDDGLAGGCGCRASRPPGALAAGLLIVLALGWVARRRPTGSSRSR